MNIIKVMGVIFLPVCFTGACRYDVCTGWGEGRGKKEGRLPGFGSALVTRGREYKIPKI